ncbi:biotin transporter BioY [Patulibacter minatonensis]|uniref:biotin transporter BioY n=1 Tax=Patulibacter minatonensis TaxID=298163 RepID=UPI00047C5A8E|nr:biotin transporter BioY [Patulibacter minatonensis]
MSTTAALPTTRRLVLADALPGARARDAALVLAGAVLTALTAQVVVPMTPVPMTGQTLAVGVVGATLGMRRGAASILLYVVLGFVLPVYADGASGVERLWGASGGYLLGFVLAAALIGWLAERGADRRVPTAFAAFVLAQLLIFVPGVLVLHAVIGGTWSTAVHDGFTVFIVGGLVKAAVGAAVLPSAWGLARRIDGR